MLPHWWLSPPVIRMLVLKVNLWHWRAVSGQGSLLNQTVHRFIYFQDKYPNWWWTISKENKAKISWYFVDSSTGVQWPPSQHRDGDGEGPGSTVQRGVSHNEDIPRGVWQVDAVATLARVAYFSLVWSFMDIFDWQRYPYHIFLIHCSISFLFCSCYISTNQSCWHI